MLIQNEKYFKYALSDRFNSIFDEIRNNAENYTDKEWQALANATGLSVKDSKNTNVYQLTMLKMLHDEMNDNYVKYGAASANYGSTEINKEEWEKSFDEFHTSTDLYENYKKNIVGDSSLKRSAREDGLKELQEWNSSGISLSYLGGKFVDSLLGNSAESIANLLDPSYTSLMNKDAYKTEYMLQLIESSRNPGANALKYSKGLISKNEYDVVNKLATIQVRDGLDKTIETSGDVAAAIGKVTASVIMSKISELSTAAKGAITALKSLNKGGSTAGKLYHEGNYSEDEARIVGWIYVAGTFGFKKLNDYIVDKATINKEWQVPGMPTPSSIEGAGDYLGEGASLETSSAVTDSWLDSARAYIANTWNSSKLLAPLLVQREKDVMKKGIDAGNNSAWLAASIISLLDREYGEAKRKNTVKNAWKASSGEAQRVYNAVTGDAGDAVETGKDYFDAIVDWIKAINNVGNK